ncbi:hypothetical protein HK100_003255 [Physocladia obscura]|uniref:Uncharacterized protein n=1 Tax=Physocladia obscura TaxID=109957 RepID=A0AAD5TA30_9FUNG|nr:hypothetical protein HK100_003255 [Physocladia obscura]
MLSGEQQTANPTRKNRDANFSISVKKKSSYSIGNDSRASIADLFSSIDQFLARKKFLLEQHYQQPHAHQALNPNVASFSLPSDEASVIIGDLKRIMRETTNTTTTLKQSALSKQADFLSAKLCAPKNCLSYSTSDALHCLFGPATVKRTSTASDAQSFCSSSSSLGAGTWLSTNDDASFLNDRSVLFDDDGAFSIRGSSETVVATARQLSSRLSTNASIIVGGFGGGEDKNNGRMSRMSFFGCDFSGVFDSSAQSSGGHDNVYGVSGGGDDAFNDLVDGAVPNDSFLHFGQDHETYESQFDPFSSNLKEAKLQQAATSETKDLDLFQTGKNSNNILDETFDIEGYDFSPTNSCPGTPCSDLSNVSIKSDDFILGNASNEISAATPRSKISDASTDPPTPITVIQIYKNTHPKNFLGGTLYAKILAGGEVDEPEITRTPSKRSTATNSLKKNLDFEDEDFSKTPMGRYFAEKSYKLGGKLGEIVDVEERPFFKTPRRDRLGHIIDDIPGTPQVKQSDVTRNLFEDIKRGTGERRRIFTKQILILSPALGKRRVAVKWNNSQLPSKSVVQTTFPPLKVKRGPITQSKFAPVSFGPKMTKTAEMRQKLVASQNKTKPQPPTASFHKTASRKPLYIPPLARSDPLYAVKHPPPPNNTVQKILPPTGGTFPQNKHILEEVYFPSTTGQPSKPSSKQLQALNCSTRANSRKSVFIPPQPVSKPRKNSADSSAASSSIPRMYLRLYNNSLRDAPFYVTTTGCGVRDGKPCAFYSSFKLETMKGVVDAGGSFDLEVRVTALLKGSYVQSFRIFANRGSVPVTLKTVIT